MATKQKKHKFEDVIYIDEVEPDYVMSEKFLADEALHDISVQAKKDYLVAVYKLVEVRKYNLEPTYEIIEKGESK